MRMTPTQEASYALNYKLGRDGLSTAGQLEYDRLLAERIAAAKGSRPPAGLSPRSRPAPSGLPPRSGAHPGDVQAQQFEVRKAVREGPAGCRIDLGGDWEEYGQIVLQMAILETLLSIEELLQPPHDAAPDV